MAQQTAMNELLLWVRKTLPMDLDYPRMIEDKIESLILKEKEQIMDAYIEAMEEYAGVYTLNNLPGDEEIKKEAHNHYLKGQLLIEPASDTEYAFKKGAKWVIEHVKKQK